MATHSSVLAWRIPGTGEPGGLPSMGSAHFHLRHLHRGWRPPLRVPTVRISTLFCQRGLLCGFSITILDEDLREPLVRRQGSQDSLRVARRSALWLSSNGRRLGPQDACPTLCNPMDCSLLGSSVHGILQARVLGSWVWAIALLVLYSPVSVGKRVMPCIHQYSVIHSSVTALNTHCPHLVIPLSLLWSW